MSLDRGSYKHLCLYTWDMVDLETGSILTPSQRKLLSTDDADMNSSTARSAKARIRQRLRAGMIDFDLVLRELDPSQIQRAFELRKPPTEEGSDEEIVLENGMASAIGMVYLAGLNRRTDVPDQDRPPELTYTRFIEKRAEKGLRVALNKLGRSVENIDVSIDIDLGEGFDELAGLEPPALAKYSETTLLQARLDGVISQDEFMAAMDEKERLVTRDTENTINGEE